MFPLVGYGRYELTATRLACIGAMHNFGQPVFIYMNILLVACFIITAWSYGGLYQVVKRLRKRASNRKSEHVVGGINMDPDRQKSIAGGALPKRDRSSSITSQLAETFHTAITIFISVILFTVAFVLTAIAEIVLSVYYPNPLAACEVSSNPKFIMANLHIFIVDFVLVINPYVYSLRNRSMRKHIMKSPHIFRSLWAFITGKKPRVRQHGSST